MLIQTVTQTVPLVSDRTLVAARSSDSQAIVAAEGSALADQLRSTGWVARSGWRSFVPGRPATWLMRFEHPGCAPASAAV